MITSTQNEKVKLAHALQTQAKTRRKSGKIVLEGLRLVADAYQGGQEANFILYTPSEQAHLETLETGIGECIQVSDEVMRHVSDTQQPQGILGVFPMPVPVLPPNSQRLLILDSIRDPGNLGTILRTAAAAGVQAVLLSPSCVDPYNPKVLRAGMGAHFRVPVVTANWDEISRYGYNTQVYLADSDGDLSYDRVAWSAPWSVIVGGEANGAGEAASALAHTRIYIPMSAETESLNAAVAASIILFEARRQTTA